MSEQILKNIYKKIYRIRSIEETIAKEYTNQKMRCPVHLSTGQEIVSAVFSEIIKKNDFSVSTHRSHAHFLAKGGNLKRMISELYGKKTGLTKGIGGSMHLVDLKVNFMGSSPIVGNIIPLGVGLGLSIKIKKEKRISTIFFGDGALEEGVFYESLNFAAVKSLPILFICENNLYSVYSNLTERQPKNRKNHKMVKSIGVDSASCDGFDIKMIYKIFNKGINYIRKKNKPFFIEFSSYRWREHCGPNFDNNIGYRTKNEYQKWKKKDPLPKLRKHLIKNPIGKKKIELYEKHVRKEIKEAFLYAEKSKFENIKELKKYIYAK